MRHFSLIIVALAALPHVALAQTAPLETNEAVARGLDATVAFIAATGLTSTTTARSAAAASGALTEAAEAIRERPFNSLLPVIDPTTFSLLTEEMQRGSRAGVLPLILVTQVVQRHVLSVAQLKRWLDLTLQTADRLQLVRLVAHRLVDPGSTEALYAYFPSTYDRRALAMILAF